MFAAGLAGTALMTATVVHLGPAVTALRPVRLRLAPALSGLGTPGHVALTFDDGPDAASTPAILDVLGQHKVQATFFVLGSVLAAHAELLRTMVGLGHEIAVHGWTHRSPALLSHRRVGNDIRRTRLTVEAITGVPPLWYRPPRGLLTTSAWLAARRAGLTPVLWSSWGRDWRESSTVDSVVSTVRRQLGPGATILLHDSDRTSAPGSWRATVAALPILLADCAARGLRVGPLAEHGRP